MRSAKSMPNQSELDFSGIAFFSHHVTQHIDTTPSECTYQRNLVVWEKYKSHKRVSTFNAYGMCREKTVMKTEKRSNVACTEKKEL